MGRKLLQNGITAIPARYGSKAALLTGYSEFFDRKPTDEEITKWEELREANIDILLGPCSNLVALDLDTDRPEVLSIIKHLLPASPVVKRGSKGETRFFRFTPGDQTEKLTLFLEGKNECILEILSEGKKTTMGRHEIGVDYKWTSERTLMDFKVSDLPPLPPSLISQLSLKLKNAFGDGSTDTYGKVVSGRNSLLSSELGKLLAQPHTVEGVLADLIRIDKEQNTPPYFTDIEEHHHGEAYTNALLFYSSHLNSYNSKRHKKNENYVVPVAELEAPEAAQTKKLVPLQRVKNVKPHELIPADSVVKTMLDNMLANSWVKQPDLALAAILALGATLCSRKFSFEGMTTNLYVLTIANSGSGKNQGLEFVKEMLVELGADKLLGAGDIGSDAGIMDSISRQPVLLFPMDEVGGILKSLTSSNSEYLSKGGDILTELYTSSTSRFLGRALSEGRKGEVDRPHLNILGATTPTGFRRGVNKEALDKGLLGRFLVFFGESDVPSTRVKKKTRMPQSVMNNLLWLVQYKAEESDKTIQGRQQLMTEMEATDEANQMLEDIFFKLDKVRLANQNETLAPIAARLYQQSVKLMIIHALLNAKREVPKIDVIDVKFGYDLMLSYFDLFKEEVEQLIYSSPIERSKAEIKKAIKESGGFISKSKLIKATPSFTAHTRDSIINELVESNQLEMVRIKNDKNKWDMVYQLLEGVA